MKDIHETQLKVRLYAEIHKDNQRYIPWLNYFSDNFEIIDFLTFVRDDITTMQCREAIKITKTEEFLQYLICAYGCSRISQNQGIPHLIRNPENLILTPEQKKQLVDCLRESITTQLEIVKKFNSDKTSNK